MCWAAYGSHSIALVPVLSYLTRTVDGPVRVIEDGAGLWSTPIITAILEGRCNHRIILEASLFWRNFAVKFVEPEAVKAYEEFVFDERYHLAFLDGISNEQRVATLAPALEHCDWVILHDTQEDFYEEVKKGWGDLPTNVQFSREYNGVCMTGPTTHLLSANLHLPEELEPYAT